MRRTRSSPRSVSCCLAGATADPWTHSAQLLSGCEIDYLETFQKKGFVFNNPNATTTCGCGSSFSA